MAGLQLVHTQQGWPTVRNVGTSSWLVQRAHGRGIGTETRSAILQFAFDGLNVDEAHSGSVEDNLPATSITRARGYEPNGSQVYEREGRPVRALEFVLTREKWQHGHRSDIAIEGLVPCLPLLGADLTGR